MDTERFYKIRAHLSLAHQWTEDFEEHTYDLIEVESPIVPVRQANQAARLALEVALKMLDDAREELVTDDWH